jgi:hypothetical protein
MTSGLHKIHRGPLDHREPPSNMSTQIVSPETITKVMDLFQHVNIPQTFSPDMIYRKLNNAKTTMQVAKIWTLFYNYSNRDNETMSLHCLQAICELLESIDGVTEDIEELRSMTIRRM